MASLRHVLLSQPNPNAARGPDKFLWRIDGNSSTTFSSKLTWNSSRPYAPVKPWAKEIWFKGNVPKHAFSFWVANLDRLPLRTRLLAWGLHISDACCLCERDSKTRKHLFFLCDFSKNLWNIILARLGLNNIVLLGWENLMDLMSTAGPPNQTLKRLAAQTTTYHIWRERNNRLHNVVSIPVEGVSS